MRSLPKKHVKRILFAAFLFAIAGLGLLYRFAKAVDGSGTNTVSPTTVTAGSTGNTLTFTYTAAETMDSGGITIVAPSGWTAPQSVNGTAGYTTVASTGMIANVEDNGDVVTGWNKGTACTTGIDAFATTKHEGIASIRCRNGNESNNDLFYKGITAENWSGYTKVGFWIYSSANIASGNLRFAYDNTAALASPIEQISFGSTITANTWTYVVLTFGATTRSSVVSYGFVIRSGTLLDNSTIYIDDILLGPGSPTFPGGGVVRANVLQLSAGQTVTFDYGAGGGASGAVAPTMTGNYTFTTQSRILDSGTLSDITTSPVVTVAPGPASQFTLSDPGNMTAGSRVGYVVTRTDQYGNAVTSGSQTAYLYSDSTGAPTFYDSAIDGSPVTSITIGDGTSTAQVWYSDTKAATATITASDSATAPDGTTGIDDATDSITVNPGATSQFTMNDPGDMTAGTRLGYVVTRKDLYGNLVTSGAQTVYLYSDSTGNRAFYNAASGGSLITSLSIGAGTSTGQFWYYDDKAGTAMVTASDSTPTPDGGLGIADATDGVTVSAAAISKFSLNDPGDMAAGSRLGYVVSREDAFGNQITSGAQTVYLYSDSANSPAFYTASSGGSPVTSITIGAGTSTAEFWYYDELSGTATITASDSTPTPNGSTGIDDATDAVSVAIGPVATLVLTNPGDMTAGTRLGYVVTRKDAYGNAVTSGSQTVYLYSTSTGNKAFYDVASGGSPVTFVTIGNGTSTAQFWYYDDKTDSVTVTASDNASAPDGVTGLADAVDGVTISAAAVSQFTLSDPGNMVSGSRIGYVVTRKDAFGNIVTSGSQTVYLYNDSTGNKAFYAASSGGSPITSVSIGAGTSTKEFWYYDDKVASVTIMASDSTPTPDGLTGIDDATDTIAVTVGPVDAFFLDNPGDMTAGNRLGYVVTRKDAYGNLVTSGAQTVFLYSDSTGNKAFYDVASGGSPLASITIEDGTSTASFWYYDDKTGSVTVTASDNTPTADGTTGIDDATDAVAVSAAATSQFLLDNPGDMPAGTRLGYTVTRKDEFGNAVTTGSDTVYLYSDSTGNKAFYAASSGGSPITSVSIGAGTSTKTFWYYDDKAGSATIMASDSTPTADGTTGIDDATDGVTVSAAAASLFTLNNPGDMTAGTRLGYSVSREDAFGNIVTSGSQTVYLYDDSTGNSAFYTASSGGSPVTSISISAGTSTGEFWYYDDKVGSVTVTASDSTPSPDGTTGIDDAEDAVTVSGAEVSQFTLNNPGDMMAGNRLGYVVTRKDAFGNINTSGVQTVYLYSDSTGNKSFYNVSSGGSPVAFVTIGDGTSTGQFWYYDDKAASVTVSASDSASAPDGTTGIDDATDAVAVSAAAVSTFTLNNPGDMIAGSRLGYVVEREDAFGNIVTSGSQTVYLYSDSTGNSAFYAASSGGSPITSVSIGAGTSTKTFWYYDDKIASVTVTASDSATAPNGDTGIDDASDSVAVTVGPVAVFFLSDPGDMSVGSRLGYVVTRKDAYGNLITSGAQTVYLYSDSTGNKAFYTVASGGSPALSITIGDGTSTAEFWYYDDRIATVTVTASDNATAPDGTDGIDDATDSVTLSPGPVSQFSLSDPGDATAGTRLGYTVTRKDEFGNAVTTGSDTVYLYSDSTGNKAFYAASSGGSPITSVSIGAGTSTKTFWYYDDKAGSATIMASDSTPTADGTTGIDDATDGVTVSAAAASLFTLNNPGDMTAGTRLGYSVSREDAFGNLVTSDAQTVYLYSDSTNSPAFYTASSGGSPVTSISISAGTSTGEFWYYDEKADAVTVTVSDSTPAPNGATGIDDATDTVTISAAATSQFTLNNPGDMIAGNRLGYVVTRKDAFGNIVTSGSQTVYLYSDSTGNKSFYDVASGGSPVGFVTVGNGTSTAQFWYYDDKASSAIVAASDSATGSDGTTGIDDATDVIAISAASTSRFLLNDPGDAPAGTRLSYVVTREDAFGNVVTSGSQTVYLYSDSTGNKAFYGASSGGSPITSVTIGAGTSTQEFWYYDDKMASVTVTASDSTPTADGAIGIDDATDGVAITQAPASEFLLDHPGNMNAGDRLGYTVTRKDQFGNLVTVGAQTVYLYSDSTGNKAFYSAASGGSPITSIVIPDGASSVGFWYYDDKTGSATVTASDSTPSADGTTGIDDASDDVTIGAAATSQFLLTNPGDMTAGERLGYTVTRKDQFGNNVTTGTQTVYLYSDSTGNKAFYTSSSGGATTTSITIGAGTSTAEFWYYDDKVGSATVTASDSGSGPDGSNGIDDATDAVAITPGPTAILLLNDPGDMTVDTRVGYTVSRTDAFGNIVTSGSQTAYLYSSTTGTALFYTSASDGSPVTSISIGDGTSTAQFWYNDNNIGTATVTVSDSASGPNGDTGIDDASDIVHVIAIVPTKFVILNPMDSTVGSSTIVMVQAQDAFGNIATRYTNDVTLNVSGSSTGGGLVDIVNGVGTMAINDTVAETVHLTLSDTQGTGLDFSSSQDLIFQSGPTRTLTMNDPGNFVAGTRVGYDVTRTDEYGNPVTVGSETMYLYSNSTGTRKAFYDAAVSGGQITSIMFGTGSSTVHFWYQDELAGTYTISVSDSATSPDGLTGIDDADDAVAISAGATSEFLLSHPGDMVAGTRLGYEVTRKDAFGNIVTTGTQTVYLYTDSIGHSAFYPTEVDGTQMTSVSIPNGSSSAQFWYLDDRAAAVTITVSDSGSGPDGSNGINDMHDSMTVLPAATAKFLLNDPGDMTMYTNIGYTVTREDVYGNLVTTGTDRVYLYTNSSGTSTAFLDAESGGSTITSLLLTDGHSSGNFWYYDNANGSWTISASDNATAPDGTDGIDDGVDMIQVTTVPITATKFIIIDPTDGTVGDSIPVTVKAVDDYGSIETTYQTDVTLVVSGDASGAGLVHIVDGVGTISIRDTVAQSVHLSLSNTEGSTLNVNSSQDVTFQPGSVSQLSLSNPGDLAAGNRIEYTVTRKDSFGNLVTAGSDTVFLYTTAAGSHGAFFDAASGGTTITSVELSGVSSVSFWYEGDQAGVFTISASDNATEPDGTTGIDDATDAVLVRSAAVAQFTLNDPGDMTESTRVGYTVTRTDVYGNLVTDGTATAYLYTNSSGTSTAFYNAASAGDVITTVTIGAGQSSAQFWYTDNGIGTWTVTASDNSSVPDGAPGIVDGTDMIQVNENLIHATRFIILDPSDVLVGGTVPVTIRAVDASGNIDTAYQHDVTLVASGSASGDGLVDIVNGVGTKNVRDMVAETVRLTLSDTEHTGLNVDSLQSVMFSSTAAPVVSSSGGGGAAAPAAPAPTPTTLRVEGVAYPGARASLRATETGGEVTLAQTTVTAADGRFVLEYIGPVDRIKSYRVVITDEQGLVAPATVFNEKPSSGQITTQSIVVAPTANLIQRSVLQGASLGVIGHSVPGSSVVLTIDGSITYDPIPVRVDGSYRVNVNTLRLNKGLHRVVVQEVTANGKVIGTSPTMQFTVSQQLNPRTDMNGDGVVDITDWSIFMSKWQSTDPSIRGTLDMNGDGNVDVTDFSIFVQAVRK